MRQMALVILILIVTFGSTYLGWEWVQKQAYIVFSHQYTQAVDELYQLWTNQSGYPQGRNWLNDFYYQRRWEHLSKWAKALVDFNHKLHLQGEFIQTVEKFVKTQGDFRQEGPMKFYILELKDRVKQLPKAGLSKSSRFYPMVVPNLVVLKALVEENQKLVRRVLPRLPQLEVIFQAQYEADTNTYCSTHKVMLDRESIISQMKQRCLDPVNGQLPMCQQGASYFQTELNQLQKLDQWNIDKLKQRWPQWREPACVK